MNKTLFGIMALLSLFASPAYAVSEWNKAEIAGTHNASDIDTYSVANAEAQDRLNKNYRYGAAVIPNTAAAIQVLAGELSVPNSGGTTIRYRSNTTTTDVGWDKIDTGAETSAIHYVYAVADTDSENFTIKLSLSSTAPSGVTYYRKIGSIDNTSGDIKNVTSYRNDEGAKYRDIVKGWVNFTGTGTIAINNSYNVSSITDNGTGDTTINWTNAFSDANYAVSGLVKLNTSGTAGTMFLASVASNPATTSVRVVSSDGAFTPTDCALVTVMAIGDR